MSETTEMTLPKEQDIILQEPAANKQVTMWNNTPLMTKMWKVADMLCRSDIVPQSYRGKTADCLIAIDMANRMNISPLMVMGASQIVKGNFSWKGQACKALIDGCGRFENSEYIMFGEQGTPEWGCYLQALNKRTGKLIKGTAVTWQMALSEGWVQKDGSKWKTMPEQMMKYRAAAFFARTECPEVLMGYQTVEEVQDVKGSDEPEKEKIKISLKGAVE
jgi:hypothetical protein